MTDSTSDLERRQRQLETLDRLAQRFGASMSDASGRSAADGKRLDHVLGQVGRTLASAALKGALKPAQVSLKTGFESLFKGLFAVGDGASVTPFAKDGVVAAPSYFPLGRGLGRMGEQGPEAILPLARGPDGRLRVRSAAGGVSGRPVSVTVNIAADAASFRRSEAQVAAALARAVARGQRGL